MPLTPADVRNKQFTTTRLRPGYDEEEVDGFLDEVETELDRLIQENEELRSKLAECERTAASDAAAGGPAASSPREGPEQGVDQPSEPSPAHAQSEPEQPSESQERSGWQPPGLRPAAGTEAEPEGSELRGSQTPAPAEAEPPPAPAASSQTESAEGSMQSASRMLALAQQTADQAVADARREADETLGRAQREAEETVGKARRQAEQIMSEARSRAEALERDAQERHRQTMGALVQQRDELERKVDDLRAFEREYRSRLKSYLEDQLRDLEAGAQDSGPAPPADNAPEESSALPPGDARNGQPGVGSAGTTHTFAPTDAARHAGTFRSGPGNSPHGQ